MADPSLSNVLSAIRAAVISRPEGVLESNLDADYRELMGTRIPFRKYGFKSIEELIGNEKSLTIQNRGGLRYVVASQSKSSHVASLIAGQKKQPARKKRSIHKMFVNAPRNCGSYSKIGSFSRGGRSRAVSRSVKTSAAPAPPKLSGQMPNYHRPLPKSTRPPFHPPPQKQVPPLLPEYPSTSNRVPAAHMYGVCPAGEEPSDSLEEFDEYSYEEELSHPESSVPVGKYQREPSKPSQAVPQNNTSVSKKPSELLPSQSTVKKPLLPTPQVAQPTLSVPQPQASQSKPRGSPVTVAIPDAPIPVPVDLNQGNPTNEYIRQGPSKRAGKGQKQNSIMEELSTEQVSIAVQTENDLCKTSCPSYSQTLPLLQNIIRLQQTLECSLRLKELSYQAEIKENNSITEVWAKRLRSLSPALRSSVINEINNILTEAEMRSIK